MNRLLLSKTVLTALTLSLLANPAGAQSAAGALKGRVALLDGGPVSGVRVSIEGSKDASITDGNGRFAIVDAAAGTRTVVIAIEIGRAHV